MIKEIEYWCEQWSDDLCLLVCKITTEYGTYFGDVEIDMRQASELIFGQTYLKTSWIDARNIALQQMARSIYSDYIVKLKSYRFLGYHE